MEKVAVIIGGSSGIGMATAKIFAQTHKVVIAGRSVEKLNDAKIELSNTGINVVPIKCDISDYTSVQTLATEAQNLGDISVVINCAGVSPSINDNKLIIEINAVGTINVTNCFENYISPGGILINLSSMSADMMPNLLIPKRIYKLSTSNIDDFKLKFDRRVRIFPKSVRSGLAYGLSKQFVRWYSNTKAHDYSAKDLRIITVSPGLIHTPMGEKEYEDGKQFIENSPISRMGEPDEIGQLIYNLADPKLTYLTATDILVDGGVINTRK